MLTIHRSERADRLVDALASILLDPLDDPFTPEVIAVPTRGVERWITQRLSTMLGTSPGRHDGVCANVEFPFPGRLVGIGARRGDGSRPRRAIRGRRSERCGRCSPSSTTTSARSGWRRSPPTSEGRTRRRRVAARPALRRRPPPCRPVRPLRPPPARADRRLGRRRRHRRPRHAAAAGRRLAGSAVAAAPGAHRHAQPGGAPGRRRATRLRDEPGLVDLPARLSLFGLTRLAASHVEVLDALGAARDVHLFLLHPSPVLWESRRRARPAR